MSIFEKIGAFFLSLFNAARRAYNKLSTEQQQALQHGSGLLAIINNMTNETPAAVRAAISAKFPDLEGEKLEQALFQVAQSFNLISDDIDDLDDVIAALQAHLEKLQGKAWAVFSHAAAALLAVLFAPPSTKVATIVLLIEWVYQNYIKKSIPKES